MIFPKFKNYYLFVYYVTLVIILLTSSSLKPAIAQRSEVVAENDTAADSCAVSILGMCI